MYTAWMAEPTTNSATTKSGSLKRAIGMSVHGIAASAGMACAIQKKAKVKPSSM